MEDGVLKIQNNQTMNYIFEDLVSTTTKWIPDTIYLIDYTFRETSNTTQKTGNVLYYLMDHLWKHYPTIHYIRSRVVSDMRPSLNHIVLWRRESKGWKSDLGMYEPINISSNQVANLVWKEKQKWKSRRTIQKQRMHPYKSFLSTQKKQEHISKTIQTLLEASENPFLD